MDTTKQRIAIAEACGHEKQVRSEMWWSRSLGRYFALNELPDYLNSLDAMHEAEKVLTQERARAYGEQLSSVPQTGTWAGCTMWHFSAAQRAEAFLRTIDKWEEEP